MRRIRRCGRLRADFLDRPLHYSAFGDLVGEHLVTVATPNRHELAEAIIGPAESVGVAADPDLVERICAEVHDRPGALPLLQHALAELFVARTANRLTLADYEAIGGVAGSLERRAEATLASLNDDLKPLVERTMLRLVTVIDDGAPMRRRVRIGQLDHLEVQVTEAFVDARLLVNDMPAPNLERIDVNDREEHLQVIGNRQRRVFASADWSPLDSAAGNPGPVVWVAP